MQLTLVKNKSEISKSFSMNTHYFPRCELSMSYKAKPSLEKGAEKYEKE